MSEQEEGMRATVRAADVAAAVVEQALDSLTKRKFDARGHLELQQCLHARQTKRVLSKEQR